MGRGALWRVRSDPILPALVLALPLVIAGCAGVASHGDIAAHSPLVLRDPAPGKLDVFLGYSLPNRSETPA